MKSRDERWGGVKSNWLLVTHTPNASRQHLWSYVLKREVGPLLFDLVLKA